MEQDVLGNSSQKLEVSSSMDHETQFKREQGEGFNTSVRKSSRPRKQSKRVLDSADDEPLSVPYKKQRRWDFKLKVNRKKDFFPNGHPFRCSLCESPYINSSLTKIIKNPQPIVKEKNGQLLYLCVKCAIAVNHTENKGPTPEQRAEFEDEGKQFAQLLVKTLNDPAAVRLYCSFYQTTKCGCIQSYIMGTPANRKRKTSFSGSECGTSDGADLKQEEGTASMDDKTDQTQRAMHLLGLLKESLAKKQVPNAKKSKDTEKDKLSPEESACMMKDSEKFILENRIKLKELGICERGCQKVLCYSNNFLHKKTIGSQPRLQRTKGRAALGQLHALEDLHKMRCCEKGCVKLAEKDQTKVTIWRQRAQQGQKEMWKVLEEMLTATDNGKPNCYKFISMVTGCCLTTVQKVYADILLSKGTAGCASKREHGMRFHWKRQKELGKSNKADQNQLVETIAASHHLAAGDAVFHNPTSDDMPADIQLLVFSKQPVMPLPVSVFMNEHMAQQVASHQISTTHETLIPQSDSKSQFHPQSVAVTHQPMTPQPDPKSQPPAKQTAVKHGAVIAKTEPMFPPHDDAVEESEGKQYIEEKFFKLCGGIKDPQEIARVQEMLAALQRDLKMKQRQREFASPQVSGSAVSVSSLPHVASSSVPMPSSAETTIAKAASTASTRGHLLHVAQKQQLVSGNSSKTSRPFVHIKVEQTASAEHKSSLPRVSGRSDVEERVVTNLAGSLYLKNTTLASAHSSKEDSMQSQTSSTQVISEPVLLSAVSTQQRVSLSLSKSASQPSHPLIIGNSSVSSFIESPSTTASSIVNKSFGNQSQNVGLIQVLSSPASESIHQSTQAPQILSIYPQSAPMQIQPLPVQGDSSAAQQLQFQLVSPLIIGSSDLMIPFNQSGTMSLILSNQAAAGSSQENSTLLQAQPTSSSFSSIDLKSSTISTVQQTFKNTETSQKTSENDFTSSSNTVSSFTQQSGHTYPISTNADSLKQEYALSGSQEASNHSNNVKNESFGNLLNQRSESARQFNDTLPQIQDAEVFRAQESVPCSSVPSIAVMNYQGLQVSGQEMEAAHQGTCNFDQYFSLLSQTSGGVVVGTPSSCSSGSFVFDALADSPVKDSSLLLSSPSMQPPTSVTSSLLCEMLMHSTAPATPSPYHHTVPSTFPTAVKSSSTSPYSSQTAVHTQTVNSIRSSLLSSTLKPSTSSQPLSTQSTLSNQPLTATIKAEQSSLPLPITSGNHVPLGHSQSSAGRINRLKDPPQVGIVLPHISSVKGATAQKVSTFPTITRSGTSLTHTSTHNSFASSSSSAHSNITGEHHVSSISQPVSDTLNQQPTILASDFLADGSTNQSQYHQQSLLSLLMNSQVTPNPPSQQPFLSTLPQASQVTLLPPSYGNPISSIANNGASLYEESSSQIAEISNNQSGTVANNVSIQNTAASVGQNVMAEPGNFIQNHTVLSVGNPNVIIGSASGQLQTTGHQLFQATSESGHVKLIPIILSDGSGSSSVSGVFPQNGQLLLSMNTSASAGAASSFSPQSQNRDSGIFLNSSASSGQNVTLQQHQQLLQVISSSQGPPAAIPLLSPTSTHNIYHQPVRVNHFSKDLARVSTAPVRDQPWNIQAVAQNRPQADKNLSSNTESNKKENNTDTEISFPPPALSGPFGLVVGNLHSNELYSLQNVSHALPASTNLTQKVEPNFLTDFGSDVFLSGSSHQDKRSIAQATDSESLGLPKFQLIEVKSEAIGSQTPNTCSQIVVQPQTALINKNLTSNTGSQVVMQSQAALNNQKSDQSMVQPQTSLIIQSFKSDHSPQNLVQSQSALTNQSLTSSSSSQIVMQPQATLINQNLKSYPTSQIVSDSTHQVVLQPQAAFINQNLSSDPQTLAQQQQQVPLQTVTMLQAQQEQTSSVRIPQTDSVPGQSVVPGIIGLNQQVLSQLGFQCSNQLILPVKPAAFNNSSSMISSQAAANIVHNQQLNCQQFSDPHQASQSNDSVTQIALAQATKSICTPTTCTSLQSATSSSRSQNTSLTTTSKHRPIRPKLLPVPATAAAATPKVLMLVPDKPGFPSYQLAQLDQSVLSIKASPKEGAPLQIQAAPQQQLNSLSLPGASQQRKAQKPATDPAIIQHLQPPTQNLKAQPQVLLVPKHEAGQRSLKTETPNFIGAQAETLLMTPNLNSTNVQPVSDVEKVCQVVTQLFDGFETIFQQGMVTTQPGPSTYQALETVALQDNTLKIGSTQGATLQVIPFQNSDLVANAIQNTTLLLTSLSDKVLPSDSDQHPGILQESEPCLSQSSRVQFGSVEASTSKGTDLCTLSSGSLPAAPSQQPLTIGPQKCNPQNAIHVLDSTPQPNHPFSVNTVDRQDQVTTTPIQFQSLQAALSAFGNNQPSQYNNSSHLQPQLVTEGIILQEGVKKETNNGAANIMQSSSAQLASSTSVMMPSNTVHSVDGTNITLSFPSGISIVSSETSGNANEQVADSSTLMVAGVTVNTTSEDRKPMLKPIQYLQCKEVIDLTDDSPPLSPSKVAQAKGHVLSSVTTHAEQQSQLQADFQKQIFSVSVVGGQSSSATPPGHLKNQVPAVFQHNQASPVLNLVTPVHQQNQSTHVLWQNQAKTVHQNQITPVHQQNQVTLIHHQNQITPILQSQVIPAHQSQVIPAHQSQVIPAHQQSRAIPVNEQSQVTPVHQSQITSVHQSQVTPVHQQSQVTPVHQQSQVTSAHQQSQVTPSCQNQFIPSHQNQFTLAHHQQSQITPSHQNQFTPVQQHNHQEIAHIHQDQSKQEEVEGHRTTNDSTTATTHSEVSHFLTANPDNKKDLGSDLIMLEQIPEDVRQVLIASLEAHAAGNPDVHLETRTFTPSDELTCRGFLSSSVSSQQNEDQFNAITRAISKNKCPSAVVTISTNQRFQDSVRAKPQNPSGMVPVSSDGGQDVMVLAQETYIRPQGSNTISNYQNIGPLLQAEESQTKKKQMIEPAQVPQVPTSLPLFETFPSSKSSSLSIPATSIQRPPIDILSPLPVLTSVAPALPKSSAVRTPSGRPDAHLLTSSTVAFIRTTNTPTDAVGPPNITIMTQASSSSSHLRFRHEGGAVPITAAFISQACNSQPATTTTKAQSSGLLKLTGSMVSLPAPVRPANTHGSQSSPLLLCPNLGSKALSQSTLRLLLENSSQATCSKEASASETTSSNVDSKFTDGLIKVSQTPQHPKRKPRKRPSTVMDLLKSKEQQQTAAAAAGNSSSAPCSPGPVTLMFSGAPGTSNLLVAGSSLEQARIDPNTLKITVKNLHLLGKGGSNLDNSLLPKQLSASGQTSGFTILQPSVFQASASNNSAAGLAVAVIDQSPAATLASTPSVSQQQCQSSDSTSNVLGEMHKPTHTVQNIPTTTFSGSPYVEAAKDVKVHHENILIPSTETTGNSIKSNNWSITTTVSNKEQSTYNEQVQCSSAGKELKTVHHLQNMLKSGTESQHSLIGQPQVVGGNSMEKGPVLDLLAPKLQPATSEPCKEEKLKFRSFTSKPMSSEDNRSKDIILPHKLQFAGDSQRSLHLEAGSLHQGMKNCKKFLLLNDKSSGNESLTTQPSPCLKSGQQVDAIQIQSTAEQAQLSFKSPQLLQLMKCKQPLTHPASEPSSQPYVAHSSRPDKPHQLKLHFSSSSSSTTSVPASSECDMGVSEQSNHSLAASSSIYSKESSQGSQHSAIASSCTSLQGSQHSAIANSCNPSQGSQHSAIANSCNPSQGSQHSAIASSCNSSQGSQHSAIASSCAYPESNESTTAESDGRSSVLEMRSDSKRNLLPSQNPLLANILFTNSSFSSLQPSPFSTIKSPAQPGNQIKKLQSSTSYEGVPLVGNLIAGDHSPDHLFVSKNDRHLKHDCETGKTSGVSSIISLHHAPSTHTLPLVYERQTRVNKVIEDVYKFPDEGEESSPPPILGSLKTPFVSQKPILAHSDQMRSSDLPYQISDASSLNQAVQHSTHSVKSNIKLDPSSQFYASGSSAVPQASKSFSLAQDSGKKVKTKKGHDKASSKLNLKKVQFSDVVTSKPASEYGHQVGVDSSVDEMSSHCDQETLEIMKRSHQESGEIPYSADISQYLLGKHKGLVEIRQDSQSICERHPYVVEQLQTESRGSKLRTYLAGNIETHLMLPGPLQANIRDVISKVPSLRDKTGFSTSSGQIYSLRDKAGLSTSPGFSHSQRDKAGLCTISEFEPEPQHEREAHRDQFCHLHYQKQSSRDLEAGLVIYEPGLKPRGDRDMSPIQPRHLDDNLYSFKTGLPQDSMFSAMNDKTEVHHIYLQSGQRPSGQIIGLDTFGEINSQCNDDMANSKAENSNKDLLKRRQFIHEEGSFVNSATHHESPIFDRRYYVEKKELSSPDANIGTDERDSAFDQPSSFNILSTQGYSKLSRQRLNRVHSDHLWSEDSSLSLTKPAQFSVHSLSTNDAGCSMDQPEETRDFPQSAKSEFSTENFERQPSESPLIRHKILESSFELARQMKKRPVLVLKDSRLESLEERNDNNDDSPQKCVVYPDGRIESIHGSLIHRDIECQTAKDPEHRVMPSSGSKLTSPIFTDTMDGRASLETVNMLSSLESLSSLRKEIKNLKDKNHYLKREVAKAEQYQELKEQQRHRHLSSSDKQRSNISETERAEKMYNTSPLSHSTQLYLVESENGMPLRKRHPSSTGVLSCSPLASSEQLRHEDGFQNKPSHPALTYPGIQQILESEIPFHDSIPRSAAGPFYLKTVSSDDHSPTESYIRESRDIFVSSTMGSQSRPTSQLDHGAPVYESLRHRYPSSELKLVTSRGTLEGDNFVPLQDHTRHRNLSSSLGIRSLPEVDPPSYDLSQRQRNPSSSSLKSTFQDGELLGFEPGPRSRNPSSSSWIRFCDYGAEGGFSVIRSRNPSGSSNRRSRPGSSSSDRELPVNVDELPLFSDIAHTRSRNSSGDSIEPTMEFLLDPQQFMQYTYHPVEALIKRTKHL